MTRKIVQISAAGWGKHDSSGHGVYVLTDDGKVYTSCGWTESYWESVRTLEAKLEERTLELQKDPDSRYHQGRVKDAQEELEKARQKHGWTLLAPLPQD